MIRNEGAVPTLLPVEIHGGTVSVRGRLTASTIALICTAVDYLDEAGTDAITVDLRSVISSRATQTSAAVAPGALGSNPRVVRLLLRPKPTIEPT